MVGLVRHRYPRFDVSYPIYNRARFTQAIATIFFETFIKSGDVLKHYQNMFKLTMK